MIVNSPSPCIVHIYAVMEDGSLASDEMKTAILAACNDENIRPLTDKVSVEDAELVQYDITMTYYLSRDSQRVPQRSRQMWSRLSRSSSLGSAHR